MTFCAKICGRRRGQLSLTQNRLLLLHGCQIPASFIPQLGRGRPSEHSLMSLDIHSRIPPLAEPARCCCLLWLPMKHELHETGRVT